MAEHAHCMRYCQYTLLLLIIIIVFVPFAPKMPAHGLDSSWALALNQAVAQGLAFGKEIIFTLGPYSSIYTKAYHPTTDRMMMLGSLYLAISYWVGLLYLINKKSWYWSLLLCIPFLGMIYARDSLLFSYPLLAGLICYSISSGSLDKPNVLLITFLFAPFGLLTLIKGSMLPLTCTISMLCFIFFVVNNRTKLAVACFASCGVSLCLFWLASGQSLINLPAYLINTVSMASSFTEAMSSDGNISEVLLYCLTSSLMVLFLALQKNSSASARLFILALYFIFLFVSFKTGFTRHFGHAFIPGTSILITALFLVILFESGPSFLILLLSLYAWQYINGQYTNISIPDNLRSSCISAWHGFKNRMLNSSWLESNFAFTMSYLRDQAAFPVLQGTWDIYSYDQSYLISSQNNWSPRPVFQSYSVFTSAFAEKNRAHLEQAHSPDHIVFKIEAIDGRMPSLEDGASWPLLFTYYKPDHQSNEFLFLQKQSSQQLKTIHTVALQSETHAFGELVNLPEHSTPLFANIRIKPSFWGKLAIILFKPGQLQITLNLKDGTQKHYRLIASMANSDFLLSPLIENTADFAHLYTHNTQLSQKSVRSLVINNKADNRHWNNVYLIDFKHAIEAS